jgi:hypothetical protein
VKSFSLRFLLVVVSLTVLTATAGAGAQGLETARQAQERHSDRLLAVDGVVGTAVGHGSAGRGAVFVFTLEPGVAGIPAELDGVPVVSHVTGEIVALHHRPGHSGGPGGKGNGDGEVDPKSRFDRPVPIGGSSGNVEIFESDGEFFCSVGTFAMRVTDGFGVWALGNNHVYAHANAASIGDAIVQPGTVDLDPPCSDNSATDAIGTLDDFVPILFDPDPGDAVPGPDNVVDAAIALSSTSLVGNSTPSDGYGTPRSTPVTPTINGKVQKYGRTTGQTNGIVWALNSTVDVNYGPDAAGNPQIARFVGQIVLKGRGRGLFSEPGDSGALVVTNRRDPIGLLFAGSSFFDFTFANPIDEVLAEFDMTIDGE